MTEFAFTGIGANPHFGTPGNPADRARVPGGSSSGAAVAVADGMCEIAIGSDTGGSVRIPAALCGIVGFKPSRQRIPTEGAFPLSFTLDSIGPMARSVADCAKADAVMAGEEPCAARAGAARRPAARRRARPAARQSRRHRRHGAFRCGARSGWRKPARGSSDEKLPLLDDMAGVNARRRHRCRRKPMPSIGERLERRGDDDRSERARRASSAAATVSAADYIDMLRERARLIRAMDARLADLDALVMPTTPIVAPTHRRGGGCPSVYARATRMLLRNTSIGNFFDLCAISLPLPARRPAGRADAGRPQRPRPPAVPHCRGGGATFSEPDQALPQVGLPRKISSAKIPEGETP